MIATNSFTKPILLNSSVIPKIQPSIVYQGLPVVKREPSADSFDTCSLLWSTLASKAHLLSLGVENFSVFFFIQILTSVALTLIVAATLAQTPLDPTCVVVEMGMHWLSMGLPVEVS